MVFTAISFAPIPHLIHTGLFDIKIPAINFSFKKNGAALNKKAVAIIHKLVTEDTSGTKTASLKDVLLPVSVAITFPDSSYNALDNFFNALSDSHTVHVLHYGDSQIEGDRITGYLRQHFQTLVGGQSAGLICPVKVNGIVQAIDAESKGDWKRYTLYGNTPKIKNRFYGPMLQFMRYAPIKTDSVQKDSIIYEASLVFKPNKNSYPSGFLFSKACLLYGNLNKPVLVQVYHGDNFICMKSLAPTRGVDMATFNIPAQPSSLTLEFTGKDSPDIYGVSFDNGTGITIDNIPLRGSSGMEFSALQAGALASLYKRLNVRLLIYEFGVNVIPYIQENVNNYEQWLCGQLRFLKQVNPQMSILVIGVSDMSMHTDSGYVSYPAVAKIRDAQRRAAYKTGSAFWDMFEAMGGENSMPVWVNAEPSLAGKDYTHFTQQGVNHISKLLYNAMYNEYVRYNKRKKQEKTVSLP